MCVNRHQYTHSNLQLQTNTIDTTCQQGQPYRPDVSTGFPESSTLKEREFSVPLHSKATTKNDTHTPLMAFAQKKPKLLYLHTAPEKGEKQKIECSWKKGVTKKTQSGNKERNGRNRIEYNSLLSPKGHKNLVASRKYWTDIIQR